MRSPERVLPYGANACHTLPPSPEGVTLPSSMSTAPAPHSPAHAQRHGSAFGIPSFPSTFWLPGPPPPGDVALPAPPFSDHRPNFLTVCTDHELLQVGAIKARRQVSVRSSCGRDLGPWPLWHPRGAPSVPHQAPGPELGQSPECFREQELELLLAGGPAGKVSP